MFAGNPVDHLSVHFTFFLSAATPLWETNSFFLHPRDPTLNLHLLAEYCSIVYNSGWPTINHPSPVRTGMGFDNWDTATHPIEPLKNTL